MKIKNLLKEVLSIIILLTCLPISAYENKIIFKLNGKSFTSHDLEVRKSYLKFIGDNNDLDENFIFEDLISVSIFNEYYLSRNQVGEKINKRVEEIYKNIKSENKNKVSDDIDEKNILLNIRLDFIRKIIIEDILNTKKNEIFNDKNYEILYNYEIEYITINIDQIDDNYYNKIRNNNNFSEIKKILEENNISFFNKKEKVNNLNTISNRLKILINQNQNFIQFNENNILTIIQLNKSFKTYEGLIANLIRIDSKKQLNIDLLNCKIKSNFEENIEISNKEYEYKKLNKQIKSKLISINDFMVFTNEDKYTYIMLCNLKFDEEIFNSLEINNKILSLVDQIERKFIKQYKSEYNLLINEK